MERRAAYTHTRVFCVACSLLCIHTQQSQFLVRQPLALLLLSPAVVLILEKIA